MHATLDKTAAPAAPGPRRVALTRSRPWSRVGLLALLVATAAFWSIGLNRNGWANAFYSAAVQAGTKSWKAFLFGSSDAANSITVDKPPASLWPMEIAARIFGANTWSIQLPEVLLGIASVVLLYVIVKRRFGAGAGLIAGLVLAVVTPVDVGSGGRGLSVAEVRRPVPGQPASGGFGSLRPILRGLPGGGAFDPLAVVALGLGLLLLTPVAGVVVGLGGFLAVGDYLYATISGAVLAILIASFFTGGGPP